LRQLATQANPFLGLDTGQLSTTLRRKDKSIISREIPLAADSLLCALLGLNPVRRVSILDSGGARGTEARFLIAGFDPFETVEAHGEQLRIARRDGHTESITHGDALRVLDDYLERLRVPRSTHPFLPATGACIATFSYDLVRRLERLRCSGVLHRATNEPDVVLAFYDTLVIHDYARDTTEIISIAGRERLSETYDEIRDAALSVEAQALNMTETEGASSFDRASSISINPLPSLSNCAVTSNFTRDEYIAAVRRIKDHIAAGDIYQANLTQQLSVASVSRVQPEHIFLRLRRDHPASFAAFIRRRQDAVVSASPERFLRVEAGDNERRVEAWPIKGTRARGRSKEEDARLRAELQGSEKDRAENVMIVDLMRNDLGRVCEYGSVKVSELFTVQEHPTLFHLVSKVEGTLREEVTAGALLRAAFPCGSVTGAPKIRAMEIIDEIETVRRGLSMGAIGYFSFDGSLDLNVAIRTMTLSRGRARFNVGGGIVADSDPELEYEESLTKALALLRALGVGENFKERSG
jgi:para-aminobenzoate synthetase component 1